MDLQRKERDTMKTAPLDGPMESTPLTAVVETMKAIVQDEYGTAPEDARPRARRLAPKPANLSFEQAAAVPVSALAALQAVRDRAQVQAGQKVLIIGASGGVGTFAVQIARAFGAEITGVCSTAKMDL